MCSRWARAKKNLLADVSLKVGEMCHRWGRWSDFVAPRTVQRCRVDVEDKFIYEISMYIEFHCISIKKYYSHKTINVEDFVKNLGILFATI